MEVETRKFARRVLIIHVILLVAVIGVVILAAAGVYRSSRDEAIRQAKQREELLAKQTARGIESYYRSILSDLELIQRSEQDAADPVGAATRPARLLARPAPGELKALESGSFPITDAMVAAIWRQLQGRASHLFIVNNRTGSVVRAFPLEDTALPQTLAKSHAKWLESLKEPAITSFIKFPGGGGHMIAVPGIGIRTIVAIVPIDAVKKKFFDQLNKERDISAVLIDEQGDAMVAVDPRLVGKSVVKEIKSPDARAAINKHIVQGQNGSWIIDSPTDFSGVMLPPRVAAAESITGLPARRWTTLIMSPMDEVNAVVNPIFDRAVLWAIFVVVSMTAILVSTSWQLIRGRTRLERLRHSMLTRELNSARKIQLAWLPTNPPTSNLVDVAALNQPASHISGDFYNWFDLPDGRLAICIGDVTGHGMSAAFLMATTQLLVRTTLPRITDPGQCLTEVNRQLCHQHFSGQFVTMLIIVLDPNTGSLELATAGHLPPMICNHDRFTTLPVDPQLVLGIDPDAPYVTQRHKLQPHACILLFTDGLLDAQSPTGTRFGIARLNGHLVEGTTNAKGLLDKLMTTVRSFCQERELGDDLTAVAVRYRPQTQA